MKQTVINYPLLKVFKELKQNEIGINEVIYLEAKINYTILYTVDQTFISSKPLKNFEAMLSTDNFLRIHKSHMVNTSFITKVNYVSNGGNLRLKNGLKLEIARRRLLDIKEKLKSLNIT